MIFSCAQVVVIAFFYYLFMQIFNFVPYGGAATIDIVFIIWGLFCMSMASVFMSILSGCIGVAHFIYRSGQSVTIGACLGVALPRAWPLWVLTWADVWMTVYRLFARFPKKKYNRSYAELVRSEALYFAWKLSTLGMLPGLLVGMTPLEAAKSSVPFIQHNYSDVVKLRFGYSFLWWVFMIASYLGSGYLMLTLGLGIGASHESLSETVNVMQAFYYFGFPMMIALSVAYVVLRPIYLISACDIYSDYLISQNDKPQIEEDKLSYTTIFFVILLCAAVGLAYMHNHMTLI